MDDLRKNIKALYEQREAIGVIITDLHGKLDKLRDDTVRPLHDACAKLDDDMCALLAPSGASWV